MTNPLVTVICLCYNQKAFVRAAIQSVLDQRYKPIELIVVDDASTDGSAELIEQLVASHPGIKFFALKKNLGNCKAFNHGLKHAKGDFIIDLAADDILNVNRIEVGVEYFLKKNSDYGVQYSDAEIIDIHGHYLNNFYKKKGNKLKPKIAEGWVFTDILTRYFICPPTLMFRKEVYKELNGYDETLAYEDFDFLLRASIKFKFLFIDQPLVKRRLVPGSLGERQYEKKSVQLKSTFEILKKVKRHLESSREKRAWRKRVLYESRKAAQLMEWKLSIRYIHLLLK